MDKKTKDILVNLGIIILFVVISFIYFYPTIQGKVLPQMDLEHSRAIAQEAKTFQKAQERNIVWTNSLFGGMPTYQIGGITKKSIFNPILRAINHTVLPYATVSTMFLYLLGFYILLLSFKVNKWISAIGALAFALSSYNIIIIIAGHATKTYAIGLMPVVIAGFILIYDKKYWLGSIIALIGFGMQVATTHIQIIYYTILTIGLFVIFKFFWQLKEKQLKQFAVASTFSVGIVILTLLPNVPTIWQAYEISKYSIRGKSELSSNKENQSSGLDKDYALAWSYGVDETFTLIIPNVKGGASGALLYDDIVAMYQGTNLEKQKAEEKLDKYSKDFIDFIIGSIQNGNPINSYWGEQPFTSGPVYLGAIICFLFILGMFIVKDKIKWWIFAATILSIVLSWGRNFSIVTDIFFDYFPFYNKFRTVSMTLVIASVTVPMLSFLAIKEITEKKETLSKNLKPLWFALGITFIILLFPFAFDVFTTQESEYFNSILKQVSQQEKTYINNIIDELTSARKSILAADFFRSLLFIAFTTALLLGFLKVKSLKEPAFFGILAVLVIADLWTIDRRFLSEDDFVVKSVMSQQTKPTPVDEIIMKDTDPYFRVLNLTINTFNDANTSYFHKSIGGYHGAKLRRYQEVIDYYLVGTHQAIISTIQDTAGNINNLLKQTQVLNMLNTKYIIYNPEAFPILNTQAFGNAWFVTNYKFVESADEEIKALGTENLKTTAIINKNKFKTNDLPEISISNDSTKYIKLTKYEPDRLEFEVYTQKDVFVVFSDIYYPIGWNAYIDDKSVDIYQTNYILRGLVVPAGKHQIKYEFKPDSVFVANKIAFAGSILVILVILGSLYMLYKELNKKEKAE